MRLLLVLGAGLLAVNAARAGGNTLPPQAAVPYASVRLKTNEAVVRDPAQLAAALGDAEGLTDAEAQRHAVAAAAKALNVPGIDWKKQMIVIIRVKAAHPDRAFGVRRVVRGDKAITVEYAYWRPVAARPQDKSPTPRAQALIALVDRFDGEVRFVPREYTPK